jgi:hypothetical protein
MYLFHDANLFNPDIFTGQRIMWLDSPFETGDLSFNPPHILLSVWHLVLLVINSIMEISYVALLIAHQSSGL